MNFLKENKKVLFNAVALIFCLIHSGAYSQGKIEGVWKSENGKYMMKIASFGDEYQGRIVWMEEENDPSGSPKLDTKNPDEKMRKLPVKGSRILKGLTYNASGGIWTNGTIYIPDTGKQYKCRAELKGQRLIITFENENGATQWTWSKSN